MDEGSRYFLAMLINKLQVSYGKNKQGTNRVNIIYFLTWRRIIILAAVL